MQFQINRYTILKKVAEYGFRSLFLAFEIATRRVVFIKKTVAVPEQYAFFRESFQNEIEITNFLDHPNILSLLDYGWYEDSFYTVMHHVDGCDLGTLIVHPQFDDSISLMILTVALETLHHCHIQRITHGDFKPSNLLISTAGHVVLTGFGMSRMIVSGDQHGYFSTPLFLSPELIQMVDGANNFDNSQFENTLLISCGNPSLSNGFQASDTGTVSQDIWAAGVLLYRICTGSYPFVSDNNMPALFSSITQHNPMNHYKFRAEVPKSIISIIGQCLHKDPNQRLSSLDPVLNVLHEHFHSQGISFFNEYIAYYLNQKSELLPFTFKEEEFPNVNFSGINSPVVEPQQSSHDYNDTKVLRHLVAPTYSLPQVSSTPTVKIDPRIIREAYESQNTSKSLLQKLRTLSRVYRVHLILATAMAAVIIILVISGSYFIEHFGNRISNRTVAQHTEKKFHFRKPLFKKKVPAPVSLQNKSLIQERSSEVQKNPIPPQQAPVPQIVSDAVNHTDNTNTTQLKPKTLQTVQQSITKKSTQSPGTGSAGTTKNRPAQRVEESNQVDNSVEQTGKLKITINPSNARVFVDGELLNNDEIAAGKELITGNHSVSAEAPEYETYSNTISIEKDQSTVLSLALKAIVKGNGQVHVFSYPWANLYIDGELKGTTPTAIPILLGEGSHEISLMREGYQTYTDQVEVKTGDVLRLKIDLKKAN
jgi:serine/threonine protein kinase